MPNYNDPFSLDVGKFTNLIGSGKTPADIKKDKPGVEDTIAEVIGEEEARNLQTLSDQIDRKFGQIAVSEAKREDAKKTFNGLYSKLNEKYGLQLKMDSDSFSEMMQTITDPRAKQAMMLYVSEAFGRFKAMLYNKFLNAIAALTDQLLDPDYLLSEDIPYTEKLLLTKSLFELLEKIEAIYSQVTIPDADTKLEHLNDEALSKTDLNDPETRALLAELLHKHQPSEIPDNPSGPSV